MNTQLERLIFGGILLLVACIAGFLGSGEYIFAIPFVVVFGFALFFWSELGEQ